MSERCIDQTLHHGHGMGRDRVLLLEIQQKLDVWDRLDKEERSELRKELSRLTAHYMREYQAKGPPGQPRRQRRTEHRPRWSTDAQRET